MNAASMPRRFLIGGKDRAEGWEVLDAQPAPYVDHVCNASDLPQFGDNTTAKIYASHVLEHFNYNGDGSVTVFAVIACTDGRMSPQRFPDLTPLFTPVLPNS
jgi:predicted SAM-dependent methyltransferase